VHELILPSPIWQVHIALWRVLTPLWGHQNFIRQAVPLMSYICWYSPYRSHLHPPFDNLVHNCVIIIAEHNIKSALSICHCRDHELTLSTAYTEYSIHQVQRKPSTAYTEYSIHKVQHSPSTAYTEHSIPPGLSVVLWISRLRTDPGMSLHIPVCLPTWSTATSQVPWDP